MTKKEEGMTTGGMLRAVHIIARELLPVLLVLYPSLLLLDDLEPGFVRSVVNPHWFLVALIVVGIVAGRTLPSSSEARSRALEGQDGEKKMTAGSLAIACTAAVIVGLWVLWRLHAGTLGIVVALLAAISVGAVMLTVTDNR